MDIKIRKVKKRKDLRELAKIEQEVFADSVYDDHRFTKSELKDEFNDPDMRTLVIEYNGDVAGYVLVDVAKEDPSAANIDSLAVAPEYAEKGLENLLMAAAEELAVKKGFDAMTIQQPENANDALKLLRKNGYQKTDTLSGFYNGVSGIEMTKKLVSREEKRGNVAPRKANAL